MYHIEKMRRLGVVQAVAPGHRGSIIFRYRRANRRILQFKLPEVKKLFRRAITKRERGHGIARKLSRELSVHGQCAYEFWNSQARILCGIYARRAENPKAYRIFVWGVGADKILARFNERWERALMLQASSTMREAQRKLALEKPLVLQPRLREDQNGKLKRPFRRTRITWRIALETIACITGKQQVWINHRLRKALDERNIALIRIKTDVFQVEILGSFAKLIPTDQPVEFWMSCNADRGVYRSKRNKLRQALKRENREKLRVREQVRTWREAKRRIRELAAND